MNIVTNMTLQMYEEDLALYKIQNKIILHDSVLIKITYIKGGMPPRIALTFKEYRHIYTILDSNIAHIN